MELSILKVGNLNTEILSSNCTECAQNIFTADDDDLRSLGGIYGTLFDIDHGTIRRFEREQETARSIPAALSALLDICPSHPMHAKVTISTIRD